MWLFQCKRSLERGHFSAVYLSWETLFHCAKKEKFIGISLLGIKHWYWYGCLLKTILYLGNVIRINIHRSMEIVQNIRVL